MAFVNMHIYFFLFLHFDTSLLLLTVTLRGVSNKHCLLSLFSFFLNIARYDEKSVSMNSETKENGGGALA